MSISGWNFLKCMSLVSATISASWASPGLCDVRFGRCAVKQLVPGRNVTVGQRGLQRRHLTAVKTRCDALSNRETSRRLWTAAPGDCTPWLPFIKTLFTLADKTELQRNRLPRKDGCGMLHSCEKSLPAVARGDSWRFGRELVLHWGDNLTWKACWKKKKEKNYTMV